MLRDTGYIPEFAQTERKQLDKRKAVISCTTLFVVLLVIAISPDAVPMHIAAVIGADLCRRCPQDFRTAASARWWLR